MFQTYALQAGQKLLLNLASASGLLRIDQLGNVLPPCSLVWGVHTWLAAAIFPGVVDDLGGLSPQEKVQLAAACGAEYPCVNQTKTAPRLLRAPRAMSCEQDWSFVCPSGHLQ